MLPEIIVDLQLGVKLASLADEASPQGLDLILEQVAAVPCTSRARPMLRGRCEATMQALYFRPRCKSWSCLPCSAQNARLWAFRAAYGFATMPVKVIQPINRNQKSNFDFVTLTSHEKLSKIGSVRVFAHSWPLLRKRVSRQTDSEYLMVPEQHRSGKLHIHMLTTAKLPKKWWKDNARACGMGYQVAVEPITDAGKAAGYTLKYVTKSLDFQAWPKGFHRVRTSQGWPRPPKGDQLDGWTFELLPKRIQLDADIELLRSQGYAVTVAS